MGDSNLQVLLQSTSHYVTARHSRPQNVTALFSALGTKCKKLPGALHNFADAQQVGLCWSCCRRGNRLRSSFGRCAFRCGGASWGTSGIAGQAAISWVQLYSLCNILEHLQRQAWIPLDSLGSMVWHFCQPANANKPASTETLHDVVKFLESMNADYTYLRERER